jgi:hypothetical protein
MASRRSTVRNAELVELAGMLDATLAAIDSGEMVASPSTRLRIEGALVALRILSGESPEAIVSALLSEAT